MQDSKVRPAAAREAYSRKENALSTEQEQVDVKSTCGCREWLSR